ncbi:recombinase family protein [Paenibacillus sp. FSL E2-0178]|uniref:recombinase family protein n=1 Tax=Paenibacillus sp. FSL E2-0178 TaxID=2921361 RepID=UPI003158C9CF
MNLGHIAIWLTDNKIPTPYNIKPDGRDKGWSNVTVQRLLLSEIHLGYITYGKTRTKRGQVEIVPEEERIKLMGTHEKLKTQEEHDAIVERLVKNRLMNPNIEEIYFPFRDCSTVKSVAVECSSEWPKQEARSILERVMLSPL